MKVFCQGCYSELTQNNDSDAHIIPNALGGNLKPKACRAKPDSGFPNQLIRDSFCPWKEPHHGQAASDRVA